MIERIDFVGFTVQAATSRNSPRSHQYYKATEWVGWAVDVKQGLVLFTGPRGESVEVPRGHCVIYRSAPKPEAKEE